MKSVLKKIIAVASALSLVVNMGNICGNNFIYAAGAENDISIFTSYNTKTNITLSIKNDSIIFEDLPDSSGFQKMILVSLYAEHNGDVTAKKQLSVSRKTTYNLSEVADGIYYIQLFYLDNSGKKFKSYWSKRAGIKIRKTGSKIEFLQPETYQSNLAVYEGRAVSKQALEYYLQSDNFVDSDNLTIKMKALEITKGITDDYEKVKAVHDWIAENIYYDYDGFNHRSEIKYIASEVLRSKKSVCRGYANLAAAFLRALEIPTKVTDGYAMGAGTSGIWSEDILTSNQSNHAWNESYVNGRWIIYDVTWDTDNKYENGEFSRGTGCNGHGYFDTNIEIFSNTHFIIDREENFQQAMCDKLQSVTCKEYVAGQKKAIWDKEQTIPDFYYQFQSDNEEIIKIDEYGVVTGVAEGRANVKVILRFHGISTAYQLPFIVKKNNGKEEVERIELPIGEEAVSALSASDMPDSRMQSRQIEDRYVNTWNQPDQKDIQEMLNGISPSINNVVLIYGGSTGNSMQILYSCDDDIKGKFDIVYRIEDNSIAKISSDGIITAKKAGKTILHVIYKVDGYKVEEQIGIYVKSAKVIISAGNKKIKKGRSKTLTAKASNIKGAIKWKTSNKKVAVVSSKGKVLAKKKGKVTITAYIGKVKSSVKLIIY